MKLFYLFFLCVTSHGLVYGMQEPLEPLSSSECSNGSCAFIRFLDESRNYETMEPDCEAVKKKVDIYLWGASDRSKAIEQMEEVAADMATWDDKEDTKVGEVFLSYLKHHICRIIA